DVHVPEIPRDVRVLAHRAPDDADLTSDLDADVDRLLHAMDIRRERRDEDPAPPERKDLPERLADDALGLSEAGTLRIRGVAEHQVDAEVPELGELADVRLEPVDWSVVELVVAGVHDATCRRLENDRHGVGDRVRHPDERDAEGP